MTDRTVVELSALLRSLNQQALTPTLAIYFLFLFGGTAIVVPPYIQESHSQKREQQVEVDIMIKNKLALDVFYEFVETNGRIPKLREFMDLGYGHSHYYRVKDEYYRLEGEKLIKHVMASETFKGKI